MVARKDRHKGWGTLTTPKGFRRSVHKSKRGAVYGKGSATPKNTKGSKRRFF